jgi:hypothetical protein
MERDFGQLILVAVFILAGLFDLFVRGRKGRARRDAPPQDDEELPFVEEDDTGLEEPGRIEPRPPLAAPERDAPPARAPARAPEPPRPPQPRDRPHRRRGRHWPMDRTDARRGIVLMTVLGPPRGLEAPPGNENLAPARQRAVSLHTARRRST